MKCLVLAGGKGERLWPLSRKSFPKQFVQIQKNHSIFQETIARNMAFCDEFIIATSYDYRSIVANQMEAFQGVTYRCIFEEVPRKTTAAITLACMDLQPSEYVFVVPANHLIDTGACAGLTYKDSILEAKKQAQKGKIAVFGIKADEISQRFGYFTENGREFIEKPGNAGADIFNNGPVYQNLGMLLFQGGAFLNELKLIEPAMYEGCSQAHSLKKELQEGTFYAEDVLKSVKATSVEHCIIEKTDKREGIAVGFDWMDIGRLEDLSHTRMMSEGTGTVHESRNTEIINKATDQAVVVNDLDDVIVVNTQDAVYVGRKGESYRLKDILHEHAELQSFAEHGTVTYREWGFREQLAAGDDFLVRKIVILPGKTIYEHKHGTRTESWVVVKGKALITINNSSEIYEESAVASVPPGVTHRLSNPGDEQLVLIETVTGSDISDSDMITSYGERLTETDLGIKTDSMVRMIPAYKDYLWGGTKLRDIYNKQCDYDIIAESWELSAHPAGNSIIANGRHKGMPFSRYIETVGKEVLGWKCAHMQAFPILIKFIDAKSNLSVQVHPDDDYALQNENEYGKNEMWYVIDAEEGAGLYVGFNRDVSKEEVAERVRNNTIMEVLNFYPTSPGDIFFIPAGTVHAIGAGNLICEIQQSSNCTYRLYDYDRRDKYGNPRELHLEKALDVLDYSRYDQVKLGRSGRDEHEQAVRCKYFETFIYEINGSRTIKLSEDSFHSAVCIKGSGSIRLKDFETDVKAGESLFIPAVTESLEINGRLTLVITGV